jgi:hypothetical protein
MWRLGANGKARVSVQYRGLEQEAHRQAAPFVEMNEGSFRLNEATPPQLWSQLEEDGSVSD